MSTNNKNLTKLAMMFNYLTENEDNNIQQLKQDLIHSEINTEAILKNNLCKIQDLIYIQEIKIKNDRSKIISFLKQLHKELFIDNMGRIKGKTDEFINSLDYHNQAIFANALNDHSKINDTFELLTNDALLSLLDKYLKLKYNKS